MPWYLMRSLSLTSLIDILNEILFFYMLVNTLKNPMRVRICSEHGTNVTKLLVASRLPALNYARNHEILSGGLMIYVFF
jgi:hypothetical protein